MLKEARDLCCDDVPNGELATIVEQALVLLIAHKKKQRFALTSHPRKQWLPRARAHSSPGKHDGKHASESPADESRPRPLEAECSSAKPEESRPNSRHSPSERRSSAKREEREPDNRYILNEEHSLTKREESMSDSRYIPSALRREVYARDGGRCSFVSQTGTRCGSRRDLEFHHIVPFAMGGEMTCDNLCLMCRAHNALLAERDYGREYVKRQVAKRQSQAVSHKTIAPGLDLKDPPQSSSELND
jgi:5-methylcytosine-specific restriction endonuclease McrA